MGAMNWKHVRLYCPHCEFEHAFKRQCWYEFVGGYIGLYDTNDMSARRSCNQELVFGEGKYDEVTKYLEARTDVADVGFEVEKPAPTPGS